MSAAKNYWTLWQQTADGPWCLLYFSPREGDVEATLRDLGPAATGVTRLMLEPGELPVATMPLTKGRWPGPLCETTKRGAKRG